MILLTLEEMDFDQIQNWFRSIPKDWLVLAVIALIFVVIVILDRWSISTLVRRLIARRRRFPGNVVPLARRQRPRAGRFSRRNLRSVMRNPLWLVALAIVMAVGFKLSPGNPLQGGTLVGRVTHVRDGDTIVVNGTPIRLNGLTCDEIGTPLGDRATRAMRRLVFGKTLTCHLNGDRTYDREVGRCKLPDGRDIGAVMISSKLCGRCARYDPHRLYAKVQREAGPFKGAYPGYCLSFW